MSRGSTPAVAILFTSAALAACGKTDDREAVARAKEQHDREAAAVMQKLRDENAKLTAELDAQRSAQEAAWQDAGRKPPPCFCDAGDPLCACFGPARLPADLPRAR